VAQRAARVGQCAALLVLLAGLLSTLVVFAGPAGADPAAGGAAAGAKTMRASTGGEPPTGAGGAPTGGRVVVIGVPGLRWSDINTPDTPTLMRLTGEGSAAAMSVRAGGQVTCAIDGWLTVSAGQRATLKNGTCALPPAPARRGDSASVPGFATLRADNAGTAYGARVGLLGDAVQRRRGCTMAVGPGAAIGAADSVGRVDLYRPTIDATEPNDWARCPLTMVDVDDVFRSFVTAGVDEDGRQMPVSARKRKSVARRADQRVAQVMALLPPDTSVLVAGLADTGVPHLHVAIARGGHFGSTYLTANSTRQPALVTLTDVTTTALELLSLPRPEGTVGQPWRAGTAKPPGERGAERAVADLDGQDVVAQVTRRLKQPFYLAWAFGQLAVYGVAALVLRRRWGGARRRWVLQGLATVALLSASVPVATFLADAVPWWDSAHPLPALIGCLVAACALVVGAARLGPWRRLILGPPTVVAAITAVVLAVDVMTGSQLQRSSLTGYDALVGGRFYGFGNIPFAVFATAVLLTAAGLAQYPLGAGRRALACGVVTALGAAGIAIDGWPGWGSDFGGVIAFVPGVAVAAIAITGRRITPLRVGGFCLGGFVMVAVFAFIDSLRPAEDRTHLGTFWGQLVAGEAGPVVARKLAAMLRSFVTIELTLLAAGALIFLVFVLARSLPRRMPALRLTYERVPAWRAGVAGVLTTAVVGFAVNDSGVAVPALALTVAVPLTLAASVRALELAEDESGDGDGAGTPQPRPTESRSAAKG
jgi:hypothetical protein